MVMKDCRAALSVAGHSPDRRDLRGRRTALNAAQLDFINLVINDLTATGVMDPGRLYESPFNAIAPHGPEVLFPSADVGRLCVILAVVKRNAMPATEAV
ncbi:hypothetical protein [Micromonospora sp. NPDC005237]|uniref:hypothetical protein n=1 Tax=unclassified Micromonospora TaxID=2617518 RepID=UPI0033B5C6A7